MCLNLFGLSALLALIVLIPLNLFVSPSSSQYSAANKSRETDQPTLDPNSQVVMIP